MKIGALAKRTGLSVRTLRYYDEINLLSPSHHTGSGHRLYSARDIARLQQIRSLRQLGFTLDEIRECLERSDFSIKRVIELHLARLREQIELERRLCERLEAIAESIRLTGEPSVEQLIKSMEVMSMFEKYYTPEQLEELKQKKASIGEERICQVEAEWKELFAQVRAEIDNGTDPSSRRVQALVKKWRGLIEEFTGGNPEIEKSLGSMYKQEPDAAVQFGMDPRMPEYMEYMSKAMAATGAAK